MRQLFMQNLKAGLIIGFSFIFVVGVTACSEAEEPSGPAMWRLQTDESTLYFLGSFHILPPDIEWRDSRIDHALDEADGVFFELDEREIDPKDMQRILLEKAMLPKGESLKSMVTAETYTELSEAAADLGVRVEALNSMKPWFVATTLAVLEMTMQGHSPDSGVDAVLTKEVLQRQIPLHGLEQFEEQFAALDVLSKEDPDALIIETLRYLKDDGALLDQMVSAWVHGDEETIAALFEQDMEQYQAAYEALLTNRNRNWLPIIEGRIDYGGSYFVIVGAAHLVGENSVIAMLRDRGYTVERF